MKVLLEHPRYRSYHPTVVGGGAELTVSQMAAVLRTAGHEVTHLVGNGGALPGVTVADWNDWFREVERHALEHDVAVLNTPLMNEFLFLPGLMSKALIIEHSCLPANANVALRRSLGELGATCITVGRQLEHHAGVLDNQLLPHDRSPLVPFDPRHVVAIGRNVGRKNLQLAAETMRRLRAHGYRGTIFTDDARGLDYDDVRVGIAHDELMREVAKAAVVLQPSLAEQNGGCVTFEAACHGVPVVISIDAADHFLVPSGMGMKAAPNVESFTTAVLELKQPDRALARAWFDGRYTDAHFLDRIIPWLEAARM